MPALASRAGVRAMLGACQDPAVGPLRWRDHDGGHGGVHSSEQREVEWLTRDSRGERLEVQLQGEAVAR